MHDESRDYLFHGEEVVLVVRPHPVVLARPVSAPLAGLALVAGFPNRFTLFLFLLVAARFSWDAALWYVDRYVLTTDRIISLSGIFTKKVVSLPLAKITDLTYARSLLGRLLGYGSLDLESAGQQDFGRIDFLPDPDHFYRAIMSLALGPRPKPVTVANEADIEEHIEHHIDQQLEHLEHPDGAHMRKSPVNPDGSPDNTDEIPIIRQSED